MMVEERENQSDHREGHQGSFGSQSGHNNPKYPYLNAQDFPLPVFQLSTMQAIQVMFLKLSLPNINYPTVTH
jgi:hypothetical protein